jgi:hypothetical protein
MMPPRSPEHMDRWARNERLYRHLLSLGLVVDPVFADEARTRIDHLRVSVDLAPSQDVAEASAVGGVVLPVQGAQIGEAIAPAEGVRDRVVIDFPTKV